MLTTGQQDRRTVADMVAVAQAKNWGSITVKGSEEFRRHAWIEAKLAGVQVHGFKSSESDQALLDAARRQRDEALKITAGVAPPPELNAMAPEVGQPKPAADPQAASTASPKAAPSAARSPASISDVKAIFAQAIEDLPEAMRTEVMSRLYERLRSGVDLQDQVARGELPRRSLGEALKARLSQLRFGGTTTASPTVGPTANRAACRTSNHAEAGPAAPAPPPSQVPEAPQAMR